MLNSLFPFDSPACAGSLGSQLFNASADDLALALFLTCVEASISTLAGFHRSHLV